MDEDYKDPASGTASAKRRALREAIFLGATVESRSRSSSGRIRNISPTGALLETSEALNIGDFIVISFRGVDHVRAIVKRCAPKGYGIQFETEIDPTACRTSTGQSPTGGRETFLLHLREEDRRRIWDNSEMVFKRPRLK
ncbi:PilZ domain-containing protein [Sphingomonas abietis]|uniref:PilZ domain-containing protein n=1 Tax=Sphingomonas abietis TaxID=3012344 RepID=A0ABY7NLT0_9SPHN|nr:PilZ domain-containing protein [Sphingomonas abietis]WBO22308.1 PilZ domain-containing protein [Sphingomonas abietis]